MQYGGWPNLPTMMFELARGWPNKAMLRGFRDGAWQGMDWSGFARAAGGAARGLRRAGVGPGDRVLIVADNRPEYIVANTALMALRAVPVPAYTTNTAADHAHVVGDSGAGFAIVGGAYAAAVAEAGRLTGRTLTLIGFDGGEAPCTLAWGDFDDGLPPDDIAAEAAAIPAEALACLIYTSGTGGAPKGVMLPHRAFLSNCRGAERLLARLRLRDEVYLSFLPLSHSFESVVGQFYLPSLGTEIVYARGIEHLAADLLAVRPTVMAVVPRILETIRGRILAQVAREPGWKQALFRRALAVGLRRAEGRAGLADRLADPLLERLVRRRVMARFGGRFRAAVSGGARLEPEVGRFFLGLGVTLLQGYGQTEAPVIAANPPEAIRIDTVGRVLPEIALRIAEDGEILVRGEVTMHGYWMNQPATEAAFADGWLHTGDVGTLTDGYLRITDRKRDLIVLSGGDNVSPAKVEGLLVAEPEIAQAVVDGDGRASLAGLIVAAEGADEAAVAAAVRRVNAGVGQHERVRRHALVEPFTIANGLLTPTMKVRRALVRRAHAETLARLQG